MMALTCQPLETWGPGDLNLDATELQVFTLQEPQEVDLLLITGVDPAMRILIRRWLPAGALPLILRHARGHRRSAVRLPRQLPSSIRAWKTRKRVEATGGRGVWKCEKAASTGKLGASRCILGDGTRERGQ